MEFVSKTVNLPKEASDIGEALAVILQTAAMAGADGFQAGSDLLAVATAALMGLPKSIEGSHKLGDEAKGAPGAFALAILAPAALEVDKIWGKKE